MPEVDELELTAKIGEILNRWPAVGLAVGVVRSGGLDFFHLDLASPPSGRWSGGYRQRANQVGGPLTAVEGLLARRVADLRAARTARRVSSHGHRGGSPPVGPGDRPALPRGPLPRCRGSARGQVGIITPIDPK